MNEFFAAYAEIWSAFFESPVFWFASAFIALASFGFVCRTLLEVIGVKISFSGFFAAIWKWLSDKVITWLCSSEKGFKLAYNLGWARPGVDYFDCGVHCDTCSKYAECNSDMRVIFDDVRYAEDPGAGI